MLSITLRVELDLCGLVKLLEAVAVVLVVLNA